MAVTYRDAGVDIDAGEKFVEDIKPLVQATLRPEVVGSLGGFSGMFALGGGRFDDPLLVASTDGVGTKLKIAHAVGRHDTVGIDLVAMCVNDIVVTGAEPLFFLDYFATGKLDAGPARAVVAGIAEGCKQAGCALLGGETAEMPGFYGGGSYDLAGFGVGVVERARVLGSHRVQAGDVLLGLASSGLHSNGYSLVRRVLATDDPQVLQSTPAGLEVPLGEELLRPTRIYVKVVLDMIRSCDVHALAHITGGGLPGNLPRVLPERLAVEVDAGSWPVAPVFGLLQDAAGIDEHEMLRTVNLGVGMVAVVTPACAEKARQVADRQGIPCWPIGRVVQRGAGGGPFGPAFVLGTPASGTG